MVTYVADRNSHGDQGAQLLPEDMTEAQVQVQAQDHTDIPDTGKFLGGLDEGMGGL
jgi:hypothetical protein